MTITKETWLELYAELYRLEKEGMLKSAKINKVPTRGWVSHVVLSENQDEDK